LERMVKKKGLEEKVVFCGYRSDMSAVYPALDLVVIPSWSEGLPNVLLEAMLYQKAIVATGVGGIPEVMQGCLSEGLIPPGNNEKMAGAIVRFLRDRNLRDRLGTFGSQHVRTAFSPTHRIKQVMEVYQSMLSHQNRVRRA